MSAPKDILQQDLYISEDEHRGHDDDDGIDSSDSEYQYQVHHVSQSPSSQFPMLKKYFSVSKKSSKDSLLTSGRRICLVNVVDEVSFALRSKRIKTACGINCGSTKNVPSSSSDGAPPPPSTSILSPEHVLFCFHSERLHSMIIHLQLDNLKKIIDAKWDADSVCSQSRFDYFNKDDMMREVNEIYVSCDYRETSDWSYLILWLICYLFKMQKLSSDFTFHLSGFSVNVIQKALDNVSDFFTKFSQHMGCWRTFSAEYNEKAEQKKRFENYMRNEFNAIRLIDIMRKKNILGIQSSDNLYKVLKKSFSILPSHWEDTDRLNKFKQQLVDIQELCAANTNNHHHPPECVSMSSLHTLSLNILESSTELDFEGNRENSTRWLSNKFLQSVCSSTDISLLEAVILDMLRNSLDRVTNQILTATGTNNNDPLPIFTIKVVKKLSVADTTTQEDVQIYSIVLLQLVTVIEGIFRDKLKGRFEVESQTTMDQTCNICKIVAVPITPVQQPPPIYFPNIDDEKEETEEKEKDKKKKIKKKRDRQSPSSEQIIKKKKKKNVEEDR